MDKLKSSVMRCANLKSSGPDKLPNLWIKQFTSLHKSMSRAYSHVLANLDQTPDWLVEGSTILLPKKVDTWIPKKYRPLAFLPTTFKILMSIITDRLYNHLEQQSIMAQEKRGGKKDCYELKD